MSTDESIDTSFPSFTATRAPILDVRVGGAGMHTEIETESESE